MGGGRASARVDGIVTVSADPDPDTIITSESGSKGTIRVTVRA